jgi:PAS domain S-box-containing protein
MTAVGRRLVVVIGILLVLLATMLAAAVFAVREMARVTNEELIRDVVPTRAAIRELALAVVTQEAAVRTFLITGTTSSLAPYRLGKEAVRREVDSLTPRLPDYPELARLVRRARAQIAGLQRYLLRQVALGSLGPAEKALARRRVEAGRARSDAFRATAGAMIAETDVALARAETRHDETYARLMAALGVLGGGALAIGLWLLARVPGRMERLLAERTAAAEETARVSRRFEAIFRAAPEGIVAVDRDGDTIAVNPAARRMLGRPASQILGHNFHDLAHHHRSDGSPFPASECPIVQVGHSGDVFEERDGTFWRGDGGSFPVQYIAAPTRGDEAGTVVIFRDVTESKARERQLARRTAELERSNAELEQFAYIASHDLQEPLRMVSGFVQLLRSRYAGRLDEDADEFIGYIVEGTDRMGALIQALLAYSRVGRGELVAARVDTVELVARTVELLGAAIAERRARVEVDSDMPTVVGDAAQLGQVFQNLIQNALKFTAGDDPRVRVSGRRVAGGRRFTVTDNGIGVDPRHAARVFKLFQRLHGREEYPGTGIGLAICQKIVERHGGTIGVEPAAAGSGSTFWFEIPDREEAKAA